MKIVLRRNLRLGLGIGIRKRRVATPGNLKPDKPSLDFQYPSNSQYIGQVV